MSYCSNCANIEAQLRDLTVANAKQAEVIREREAEREALLEVFATIESESYTTKGAYKGALCDVLRWLNATLRSKPSPTSKQDSRTETADAAVARVYGSEPAATVHPSDVAPSRGEIGATTSATGEAKPALHGRPGGGRTLALGIPHTPQSARFYATGEANPAESFCEGLLAGATDAPQPEQKAAFAVGHESLEIVTMPGRMGGRPTIGHSRLTVAQFVGMFQNGQTVESVHAMWDYLPLTHLRILKLLAEDLAEDESEEDGASAEVPLTRSDA